MENHITRWLRETMEAAGIDMSIFSAHSVRSATVSNAYTSTRLPLTTILRTGGWTSESTFSKFYNKPIANAGTVQKEIMKQHQQRKKRK